MLRWLRFVPLLGLLFFLSCTNKITHRPELILISHSQEIALGDQAAAEILKREKVVRGGYRVELVESVFRRLLEALPPEYRNAYKWRVFVIAKKEVNAFALPNGNVFVYTGLLDFVKDDPDQLAAVLSHEIAHVILRHGAEKVSSAILAQLGGELLMAKVSPEHRPLAAQLYGLGVGLAILLPYSRRQEMEADLLGLIIMMRAGFNPEGALKLWEKMVQKFRDKEPPEWLSDHPAGESRLQYIKRAIDYLRKHPEFVQRFEIPEELLE
jgi:predicted Zn-dependent protease